MLLTRRAPLTRSLVVAAIALASASTATAQDLVLYATDASRIVGSWSRVADSTAAGGARLRNPNAGAAKLTTPLAAPASYFELTFEAPAGTAFRLWIRGKADSNSYANDSVFVQFSDSLNDATPAWRIGTTSATTMNLEDCGTGCGLSGWGWQDNGWGVGVLGPLVTFASDGTHTLRIQPREDGLSIDQVVLSASRWLTSAPGALKNDTTVLAKTSTGDTTPPAATVVRGPYLQQVSPTGLTVVWATRESGAGAVTLTNPDGTTRTVSGSDTLYPASQTGLAADYTQHEVAITALVAETTYAYALLHGGAATGVGASFTTAPPDGTGTARFIAFGDSGVGSTAQETLASLMTNDTFDVALHAGDIAYGVSSGIGGATYATYDGWFFDIYKAWLPSHAFWPTLGNHDDRIDYGAAYRNLFVLPRDGGAGAYPDHAERYFSFDVGPVHFICLDTERAFQDTARRQAQVDWLKADLAATSQPWRVAYFHRSPYSSGGEHGSDVAVRQAFGPVFQQYGVQLAVSGHEHDYERSVPWRTSGTTGQATTYVVTGGGGAPTYTAGTSAWTAVSRQAFEYVRGTIAGCTASLETVGIDGAVFDRYVLDRCQQAADIGPPSVSIDSPAGGATVGGTVPVSITATDDQRVDKVDLWVDGTLTAIDLAAPYTFEWPTAGLADGAHTLEARAYDLDGNIHTTSMAVTVSNATSSAPTIVLYAADASTANVHGNWTFVSDASAAVGVRLRNPNLGAAKVSASATPASYVDLTFEAVAGVPYHLWLRMKADSNSYNNDSVSVQFSGAVTSSGAPTLAIGTTSALSVILEEGSGAGVSGWGWNDNGYGTLGSPITFGADGPQTIRIQVREDGVSFDQIVLSPSTYFTTRPGATKNDATVVAK